MGTAASAPPMYRRLPYLVAALYLVAVLLAGVQAVSLDDPRRTLIAAIPYAAGAAVYLLVSRWAPADRNQQQARAWIAAIGIGGVALSLWAVASFLMALPAGIGEPSGFYQVKVRVSTPVGEHNSAAGLLLVGIVACAVLAQRDRRWYGGLVVCALGVVATLSRGGGLVLLVVALCTFLLSAGRWLALRLLVTGLVTMGAILLAAVLLDSSPPAGRAVSDGALGASVTARADLAVRGLDLALDNPILGVGLGRFEEDATDLPPPNDHAHQLFAHAAAEGGLPLGIVALGLPFVLIAGSWHDRSSLGDLLSLGGLALVGHAQLEIQGGRIGYELTLAALLALSVPLARRRPELASRSP